MGINTLDVESIDKLIGAQKTAFISSVDENGFPNVKAMQRRALSRGT